jgi:FMN-dependent NADH-azoreductase
MTILHVDSSILGDNSVSRQLTAAIVERVRAADAAAEVIHRDLAANPLPHFTLTGDSVPVDEFLAADTVVIGAPMYNFSVPSQLKAWIDHILVAGKTFKYGEMGVEGLAGPKRVIIAVSRGGIYSAGSPAAVAEHLETYLTTVFGFIGLSPEIVVAEGINLGPEVRAAAIDGALGNISALAA